MSYKMSGLEKLNTILIHNIPLQWIGAGIHQKFRAKLILDNSLDTLDIKCRQWGWAKSIQEDIFFKVRDIVSEASSQLAEKDFVFPSQEEPSFVDQNFLKVALKRIRMKRLLLAPLLLGFIPSVNAFLGVAVMALKLIWREICS